MSQQKPPSYADKVKQSLEKTGKAPDRSASAEQSLPVSKANVLGERPSTCEKSKDAGAIFESPAHKHEPFGEVGQSEGQTEVESRSEQEGVTSFSAQTKKKLSEAKESLKSSFTRSQEKLHEALPGNLPQQAGQARGPPHETLPPDPNKPGFMEQLTSKIAEQSKKVTEKAQIMTGELKSSLGLGKTEIGNQQRMTDEEGRRAN